MYPRHTLAGDSSVATPPESARVWHRSVAVWYVVALTLVAVLNTIGFVYVESLLSKHRAVAALVNISGRQRVLSQQIALFASRSEASNIADARTEWATPVSAAAREFDRNHAQLVIARVDHPAAQRAYTDTDLDRRIEAYLTSARALGEAAADRGDGGRKAAVEIRWASRQLLNDLDRVVAGFEESLPIDAIVRNELLLWLATLVLLALEALFIFRPLVLNLRRYHRQLRQRSAELQRSNRQLSQFTYVASHDLQEPLRMVDSYITLLRDDYGDSLPNDAKQYMTFATEGAQRMQRLVDDLLLFARTSENPLHAVPVSLDDVVANVRRDLMPRLDECGGTIEVDPLPVVHGSESQIHQALQNLLGNALKFRSEDRAPVVRIRSKRQADAWIIDVQDNGIGFSAEFAEKIFRPFQRLHLRSQFEGNGIGLSVVETIMERHEGSVSVVSTPGRGSTFSLHFPTTIPTDGHGQR